MNTDLVIAFDTVVVGDGVGDVVGEFVTSAGFCVTVTFCPIPTAIASSN